MKPLRLAGIFISALISLSAFAGPKVGDLAVMDGKYANGGASVDVSLVRKVTAYNGNTDVYVVQTTQTVAGDAQTADENVASKDMISEEDAAGVVANCAAFGGSLEKVSVKAGDYDTCHVKSDTGGDYWIAPVPFGLVKIAVPANGGSIELELSTFARG